MPLISSSSKAECDHKAVKIIQEQIAKILRIQNHILFAVPGGRSVSGIFYELLHVDIPWTKVHFFMIDERMVPWHDKESNFRLVGEAFLNPLLKEGKISKENIHPFKTVEGIGKYQRELQKFGGKFDIILVSSGEDGHIAALFPNHHSVKDLSPFFITMDDSPKPPSGRMSSSVSLLKKSQAAVILFYGEEKRTAYEAFQHQAVNVLHCPAKIVLEVPECYVVTDLV